MMPALCTTAGAGAVDVHTRQRQQSPRLSSRPHAPAVSAGGLNHASRRHTTTATAALRPAAASAAVSTTATPTATTDRQRHNSSEASTLSSSSSSALLPVPLDFYACLGVTRTAGSRAVRSALDKALLQRPAPYYSSDTVALRDLLLRTAADCLVNYEKRREYDATALSSSGYVVSVSEDHLPGALVLLQESGCDQLVLDVGGQWLATNNRGEMLRRDVTAVMALAHHSLAVQALQQQQDSGSMLGACRHLESALVLIRQSIRSSEHAGAAADLQQDIMQLLKDYSPDYCLALLALPLADPQRQRGHSLLRKLLYELPDDLCPVGGTDKDDFLAAARPLMTAQEHLALAEGAARGGRVRSVMQQQLVAEAMVAVAFREQRPLLLMQAARAFRELEQAPGVAADAASTDMCVERACISLLLGDTNAALEALGLEASAAAGSDSSQQQAATSPTQQAARDYVLAHCPDRSDLLPGVYALAQCWMQQGILGGFRHSQLDGGEAAAAAAVATGPQQADGSAQPLDLSPWFDSAKVRLVILVLAVGAWLKQCMQAATRLPAAVAASLVWLQQRRASAGGTQQTKSATDTSSSSEAAVQRGLTVPSSDVASSKAQAAAIKPRAATTSSSIKSLSQARNASRTAPKDRGGAAATTTAATPVQPPVKAPLRQAASAPLSSPRSMEQQPQPSPTQRQQPAGKRQAGQQLQAAATQPTTPAASDASPAAGADNNKAAAAGDATPSLMARVRAAAGKTGSSMDEEDGEAGFPSPSPAVHWRLSQQMVEVEALMWDPAPEPAGWGVMTAKKVLPVVLLGVAAVVAVCAGGSRGHLPAGGSPSAPQGPSTLLFDARG